MKTPRRNLHVGNPTPRRRSQGGFTLVEIMVVVVIIGLLATLVTGNLFESAAEANMKKAFSDCSRIHAIATEYSISHGQRIPSLEDLTTPDDNGRVYIESETKDPWENDYVIQPREERRGFIVMSMGEDGYEDTEDDIIYPKPREE